MHENAKLSYAKLCNNFRNSIIGIFAINCMRKMQKIEKCDNFRTFLMGIEPTTQPFGRESSTTTTRQYILKVCFNVSPPKQLFIHAYIN